jgi:hypothetical protein
MREDVLLHTMRCSVDSCIGEPVDSFIGVLTVSSSAFPENQLVNDASKGLPVGRNAAWPPTPIESTRLIVA